MMTPLTYPTNSNKSQKLQKVVAVLEKYLPMKFVNEIIANLDVNNIDRIIVALEYARSRLLNSKLRTIYEKERSMYNEDKVLLLPSIEYYKIIVEIEELFNKTYEELDGVIPGIKSRYEELMQDAYKK